MYQVFGGQMLDDLVDLGYTERSSRLAPGEDDESGDSRVSPCVGSFRGRRFRSSIATPSICSSTAG